MLPLLARRCSCFPRPAALSLALPATLRNNVARGEGKRRAAAAAAESATSGMRPSAIDDRPSPSSTTDLLVPVSSTPRIRKCRLLRRYKRFLADVVFPEDDDGESESGFVTVHCPNTGPMTGLLDGCPRAEAWASVADDPQGKRKYQHTLEAIRPEVGCPLVGVHSAAANKVVRALLEAGVLSQGHEGEEKEKDGEKEEGFALLPRLRGGEGSITAEFSYGKRKKGDSSSSSSALSRADFLLQCGDELGDLELLLEVKSVTLAEGGLALFPDTVSVRAQRHARDLEEVARSSSSSSSARRRAAIVFLIQRGDCDAFSPSEACDPEYCRALRSAARAGVLILAVRGEIVADEEKGMLFRYLGRARVELGEDDKEEEEGEEEEEGGGAKKAKSRGNKETIKKK